MALDRAQRGVLTGMLAAVGVTLVVLVGAILWQPAFLVPTAGPAARLAAALQWDLAVLACLILSIGLLARHRFFTPADIDGSGLTPSTDRARVRQAILQNTLEQSVIAVIAHLAWAAAMPSFWQPAVPAAVALFVLGRVCFARGYGGGAAARAFGFALTFYPTVLLAVIAGAALLWRVAAGGM